jgi:RNA polymerase-binding transcription factor DksA
VSELQAIWPDRELAAAPTPTPPPTAQTATSPSPVDDATRLEGIVIELAEVEAALRRLDDGSYGICQACGTRLNPESLEADPLTTRCPQHAG